MEFINKFIGTFKGDRILWLVVVLLTLVSIMTVYSSTSMLAYKNHVNTEYYLFKHLLLIIVAFFFMWFMHLISYQYYSGLYKFLLPISIVTLIYASVFGSKINDAGRWIKIPVINQTFQASDLAKLALILFLARYLSKYQDSLGNFKQRFLPMMAVILTITFLVFLENISTGVMIFTISIIMLFIGKVSNKHLIGTLSLGSLVAALGIFFVLNAPDEYLIKRLKTGKSRIESFMKASQSKEDVSYQVKQANIAIARGGLMPNGPGNSRQKNFLPNAFSDYVFAIIVEEWGLIGGLSIVLLYLIFMFRVIKIVVKSPKTFGALLALGLGLSIVIQAFFNIGVTVGVLPATGVTLPLVSMGGSSIVFIAMAVGIIISVSRSVEDNTLGKEPIKENYIDELELELGLNISNN